jgi:hypothetical protein
MEQRIYNAGSATPDGLADFLAQNYYHRRWVAQKLGTDRSVMVQIGRERHHQIEPAVSLAIAYTPDDGQTIAVTMGEQNWITPGMAEHAAMTAAVGVLFTPWALFGLLSPARHILAGEMVPGELWNLIDTYMVGQGGSLLQQQDIAHPHM